MRFPRLPHRYVMYDSIHRGAVFCVVSFTAIVAIRMGIELGHCMIGNCTVDFYLLVNCQGLFQNQDFIF